MSDIPENITPPVDVLQGYFDDLLAPVDSAQNESASTKAPEQRRSNVLHLQPELQTKPAYKTSPQKLASQQVAERLAKAKLSRLLTSAPAATETIEGSDTSGKQALQTEDVIKTRPQAELTAEKTAKADQKDDIILPENTSLNTAVLEADDDKLAWLNNGRPAWAQERFDVLLFEVSGLTLAVPLICLGQIQLLTDELTPLFGQADWFMGLQPTATGKVSTVNTAMFVMPERYDDSFLQTAKYVVSIDGLPWGLAVCAVNQPISLDPDDVKWRSDRTKRPWLAGTVKEHRCALLDIATMGKILQDMDVSERSKL